MRLQSIMRNSAWVDRLNQKTELLQINESGPVFVQTIRMRQK